MGYGRLDYPVEKLEPFGRQKIVMEANTADEQAMRLVACSKEPWTVDFIEEMKSTDVLWDIGANVGPYTLLASARGVQVVAFEPAFENFATLCRNLALNDLLDHVVLIPVALGDSDGLIWLHHHSMASGSASHILTTVDKHLTLHKQLVPIMTGQSAAQVFHLPMPTAIKIDVDGGELGVLAGLEFVLAQESMRKLIIELNDAWDGAATTWLAERGWILGERWDNRGPIYYARFERAPISTTQISTTVSSATLVNVAQ